LLRRREDVRLGDNKRERLKICILEALFAGKAGRAFFTKRRENT